MKILKTIAWILLVALILIVMVAMVIMHDLRIEEETIKQNRGKPLEELEDGGIYDWIFVEFIPEKGVELPTHLGTVSMCLTKQWSDEHLYAEFDSNSVRDENGKHTTKIPNPFRYKKEVFRIKLKDGTFEEVEHWFIPIPKLKRIQLIVK